MELRQLLALDDQRVNVGEWDWEAFEAHKRGSTKLSQRDLMAILKKPDRLEQVQREARNDACNARRLCVVIDRFFTDAECDEITSQLTPLLNPTKSASLRNLVINTSTTSDDADKNTQTLLTRISERLWARLNELESVEDDSTRQMLRELQIAHEWSCRDYHVRHASRGGQSGEMEMRLRAMSDHVRVMDYRASDADGTPAVTGDGQRDESQDDGDFATDPRNAHHDGRNRQPAGDSFVTALLYLNSEDGEGLEGGHTLFLDDDGRPVARVSPRKGSLLLFDHHLYHRGERVRRGTKLCLRSDLLYMPCDVRTGEPIMELMCDES